MIQDDRHTTIEQRFFFPINAEAEHHSSFDAQEMPAADQIPGFDHYVIAEKPDSSETGYQTYWNQAHVPAGSIVQWVGGTLLGRSEPITSRVFADDETLDTVDILHVPSEDDKMIVRVHRDVVYDNPENEKLATNGVLIVPKNEPLPTADELGLRKDREELRYSVAGFIDADDALVTTRSLSFAERSLVDWCVAHSVAQNGLEQALLAADMPPGLSLMGILSTEPAIEAYLSYHDTVHGTDTVPKNDPDDKLRAFPNLTDEQRERYFEVQEIAHSSLEATRTK